MLAHVFTLGEILYTSAGEELFFHDYFVILLNLGKRGKTRKAFVEAVLVGGAVAQFSRAHTIEGGGLVQLNKWVSKIPVPPRRCVFVYNNECSVRFFNKNVGKGHAHGATANNEIVCG